MGVAVRAHGESPMPLDGTVAFMPIGRTQRNEKDSIGLFTQATWTASAIRA